jgi:hypothetical protein
MADRWLSRCEFFSPSSQIHVFVPPILTVGGDGADGVRGLAAGGDEGISSTAKDVAPHVVANHPTTIITST